MVLVWEEPEPRYPPMELLAFALVVAAHRLRPYFQAHPIKVLTEVPLKKVLQCSDTSECLVNWLIKMSKFDIDYVLRMTIKGQILVDFVSEMTGPLEDALALPEGNQGHVYIDNSSC